MLRQQIWFEWQVTEDSALWDRLSDEEALPAKAGNLLRDHEHHFAVRLLHGIAVLAIGIIALSSVAQSPAERERIRATAGVRAVLAREAASHNDNQDDPDPSLLAVDVIDGVAVAELLVYEPVVRWRMSYPYRVTRFYRDTGQGWLQMTPDQDFWGGKRYLNTDHLRFEYYVHDAPTVAAIAGRIDEDYQALHEMLGLEPPRPDEQVAIVVKPTSVGSRGVFADRIEAPSPLMAQIPEGMSDADYLSHRVINRLLYQVISRIDEQDEAAWTGTYRWQALQRGLRSWLETRLVGQPWPWDQEAQDLLREDRYRRRAFQLTDVNDLDGGQTLDREGLMLRYAVAESVISYAVETYGQECLVRLIEGLRTYNSWQQLTTHVFGVSVEEFESGWNHYLQRRYGPTADEDAASPG